MKTIWTIAVFLAAMTVYGFADDLPPIPKELKGFHYSSDTNVTAEVHKAMQAAAKALKQEGYKKLDGTKGMIYHVKKENMDYWVMCQSYSISKEKTLVTVVGAYVWVILDKDFKFKEMKSGA